MGVGAAVILAAWLALDSMWVAPTKWEVRGENATQCGELAKCIISASSKTGASTPASKYIAMLFQVVVRI
jgi:hypothetical protein